MQRADTPPSNGCRQTGIKMGSNLARDCTRLGPPEAHGDRTRRLPVTSQNIECRDRAPSPSPARPSLVRTGLAALAGPQWAPGACAVAPPPAAGPGVAAFPAPEQWFRGLAPGSRKAKAAGRRRQRSARQPRQQAAGGSRALREPPLPSRAPGGRRATRRGPHAPRATRQASMALRPPCNPSRELSSPKRRPPASPRERGNAQAARMSPY